MRNFAQTFFRCLLCAVLSCNAALAIHVGEVAKTPDGQAYEKNGQAFLLDRNDKLLRQQTLFEAHFSDLFDFANMPNRPDEKAFFQDVMHIQRIIQDPVRGMNELQHLETSMAEIKAHFPNMNPSEVLDAALSKMEAENFFPESRVIALGELSGTRFVDLPANGFVLRDLGIAVEHGDAAHRLQWAMIISNFNRNPDQWNLTPYELFTKIGERDTTPTNPGQLWIHLFDNKGYDTTEAESDPPRRNEKGKELTLPDGYRHPDRLTAELIGVIRHDENTALGQAIDRLPNIRSAVFESYNKARTTQSTVIDKVIPNLKQLAYPDPYVQTFLDNQDAIQDARSAEIQIQMGPSYQVWQGDSKLLIHRDDLANANREPLLKLSRIALSRNKHKGEQNQVEPNLASEIHDRIEAVRIRYRPQATSPPRTQIAPPPQTRDRVVEQSGHSGAFPASSTSTQSNDNLPPRPNQSTQGEPQLGDVEDLPPRPNNPDEDELPPRPDTDSDLPPRPNQNEDGNLDEDNPHQADDNAGKRKPRGR